VADPSLPAYNTRISRPDRDCAWLGWSKYTVSMEWRWHHFVCTTLLRHAGGIGYYVVCCCSATLQMCVRVQTVVFVRLRARCRPTSRKQPEYAVLASELSQYRIIRQLTVNWVYLKNCGVIFCWNEWLTYATAPLVGYNRTEWDACNDFLQAWTNFFANSSQRFLNFNGLQRQVLHSVRHLIGLQLS